MEYVLRDSMYVVPSVRAESFFMKETRRAVPCGGASTLRGSVLFWSVCWLHAWLYLVKFEELNSDDT